VTHPYLFFFPQNAADFHYYCGVMLFSITPTKTAVWLSSDDKQGQEKIIKLQRESGVQLFNASSGCSVEVSGPPAGKTVAPGSAAIAC
jgi:hypothetical protein